MKIAFVDDLVHKKTNSTEFLVSLLKKRFKVKRFWGSGTFHFPEKNIKAINKYEPDIILFFQRMPILPFLLKLKCKRLLYIPMFDQSTIFQKNCFGLQSFVMNLLKLKKQKYLCFSKKDHNIYSKYAESMNVQYYPKPLSKSNHYKKVFFWERTKDLDFEYVTTNLINLDTIKEFVFKQANDPGQVCKQYKYSNAKNITLIKGWIENKEYLKLMKGVGIGIAPRINEGIGHGFLELMARGICVIAHDEATHNEYITNGYNGILYNYSNPKVNLSNWKELAKNARKSIKIGHASWELDKLRIVNWLKDFDKPEEWWYLE